MVEPWAGGRFWRDFDWFLLGVVLLLSVIGLVEIYSSTLNLDGSTYFERQMAWVGIGVALLLIVASLDYHALADQIVWVYGAACLLLGVVLLIGHTVSGSQSWLRFGVVQLQPSEITKLVVVIALARFFASIHERYLSLSQALVATAICAGPVALVALQGDLGTALTFVPILAAGLFVRGLSARVWIAGLLIAAVLLTLGWFGLKDYQRDRIMTFVHPETDPTGAGYQVIQSKIAIGAGGIWGTGLFQGSQNRLGFLPTRHTDFIFSVLAEETGFAGVSFALALFFALLFRSLSIADSTRDALGLFIVVGVVGMFAFHIIVNVGMVIGFMPITGIPLPFLSYGGSSILTAFIGLGFIVSVKRCRYVN